MDRIKKLRSIYKLYWLNKKMKDAEQAKDDNNYMVSHRYLTYDEWLSIDNGLKEKLEELKTKIEDENRKLDRLEMVRNA